MQDVFIIGSRGLPAQYGGFETFVEELIRHQQNKAIRYHVACLSDSSHHHHFDYKGADCFTINPPKIGPARVIAYDMMAISYAISLIKKNHLKNPIVYILGNTVGAFIAPLAKRIKAVGGRLFVNPDGLEWKRSKWIKPIQIYLKYSEKVMTKHADLMISDNMGIDDYLKQSYPWVKTRFIAYGTDMTPSPLTSQSEKVRTFFNQWASKEKEYFLIVGRFVPENNYALAIEAFMASKTQKDLMVICNHQGNAYFEQLKSLTGFENDNRIKFVGTVYDKALLTYIREQAFAYIHGHEVGGTNPGLLEALAHTELNLVLDVNFNRKVAENTALYWSKEIASLTALIDTEVDDNKRRRLSEEAKAHMSQGYTWEKIVGEYEDLFLNES